MAADRGVVALADGGRLAYEVTGAGPPLLLCRWGAGGLPVWRPFADALAASHRVIAFDPRGTGGSTDAPFTITTRRMARDAVALLDALEVARADVFGESLGGMTGSWLAIDTPGRVDRLVLASTLPEPSAISPRALVRGLGFARCFAGPPGEAIVCALRRMTAPRFCAEHPDRMAAIEAALRRAPSSRRNMVALGLAALRHRAGPALRRARAPTLLLFGELDPLVGHVARAELVAERPGAVVEVLAGVGHALTLEQPVDTAARVRAFLAGR